MRTFPTRKIARPGHCEKEEVAGKRGEHALENEGSRLPRASEKALICYESHSHRSVLVVHGRHPHIRRAGTCLARKGSAHMSYRTGNNAALCPVCPALERVDWSPEPCMVSRKEAGMDSFEKKSVRWLSRCVR